MARFLKRLRRVLILLPLAALLVSCAVSDRSDVNAPMTTSAPDLPVQHLIDPDSEVRGVWIASVWNIDFPSAPDLSADALKAELDAILATCAQNELNTIFFQVRPMADALYKSALFPVSTTLSSTGNLTFDPLGYLVEAAHRQNIRVHAWVNPLRITLSGTDTNALPAGHPARQHPEWTVAYADGRLYFNAGIPEVRQFVAEGVREIVKQYDVDGVVFDDYFYPYPAYDEGGAVVDFPDDAAFTAYGTGFDSRADWRRENVNKLVRLCYDTVHYVDPECVFGVSPYAVWQNDDGENGGSATSSFEAYKYLFCDALAWIEGGYVDYISPQIYWEFTTEDSPFDTVVRWWNDQLDGTGVKLYVSHASYKYEEGEWANPQGALAEQVTYARSERSYYGSVFYGYDEIKRNIRGASDDIRRAFEQEIIYSATQSNGLGVTVSSPAAGSVLDNPKTYLLGMSDPYYALTMNGQKVGRTKSGYFSLMVTLLEGDNVFVFEQNGVRYRYTLTYRAQTGAVDGVEKEEELVIHPNRELCAVSPSSEVITGENILWVSCSAPVDSTVSVNIGGRVTELVPLSEPKTKRSSDGVVYVNYGANAALPEALDGQVIDCGLVRYTGVSRGVVMTAETVRVRVMGKDAPLGVRANADYAGLKITPSSSVYNDYTDQAAGMTDRILSLRNGYYQLRMGGYMAAADVTEIQGSLPVAVLSSATVVNCGRTTEFRLKTAAHPPYNGNVEDGAFVVTFYSTDAASAPEPVIGDNPLIESCEVTRQENRVRYRLKLYDQANFYGFDLEYRDGETVVTMRNPIAVDLSAEKPLAGVKIVLDAGHGGDDPGAFGPVRTDAVLPAETPPPAANAEAVEAEAEPAANAAGNDGTEAAAPTETGNEAGIVIGFSDFFGADADEGLGAPVETPAAGTSAAGTSTPGGSAALSNSEKDLNLALTLAVAEKLRATGAEVILLREDDVTLPLNDRVLLLESLEPDLCLSLHQNSMGYSANVTHIRGTLGLWCEAGGRLPADCIGRAIADALDRSYRGTEWQMLAMCRNPKFPAALVEVGFMTSVEEFEYMTSARGLEAAAQGVYDGVMTYFEKMTAYAKKGQ